MFKSIKFFIILVFLSIVFYVCYYFNFLNFRSGFIYDFFRPFSYLSEKQVIVSSSDIFLSKIKTLEGEKRAMISEISRLNRELQTKTDYTRLMLEAKIISFEFDKIQIDRGSSSGVSEKQFVIVGNNLIGNVQTVLKNKSMVLLLNNPMSKNYCYARQGDDNIWGILTGGIDGKIYLTKISGERILEKNVRVFCEGLEIGQVYKIEKNVNALFYMAEIVPSIEVEKLNTVYVRIEK
jgi:cell shape-determining protein MreC